MTYEAFRISYQDSEQAARAAYALVQGLTAALDRIANMKNRDGVEIEMHRDELRAVAKSALREAA